MLMYKFVETGSPFIISFDSNITTGYSWTLTSYPTFIRILGDNYYENLHPPGMVGVGGKQVFTLIADYSGEGMMHFDYGTPWGEHGNSQDVYVVAR